MKRVDGGVPNGGRGGFPGAFPPGTMPPRRPIMRPPPPLGMSMPAGMPMPVPVGMRPPPMATTPRGMVMARPAMPFARAPAPMAPAVAPIGAPPSTGALPPGWSEHFTPQGIRYFYNAQTGVSTYEPPNTAASRSATPSGGSGVSNPVDSTADPAVVGTWIEYKDEASGQFYYYNTETKATVWDQPEEYRMQKARAEVERMQAEANAEEKRAEVVAKRKEEEEQVEKARFESLGRDERVAQFKQFLEEQQISPQLRWQELQRHIAKEGLENDPRWKYALSSSGQKKQIFAEYCTQVTNKQTIERRRLVKKIREDYLELLGSFESKMISMTSLRWEDVLDSPVFYTMRKDARWTAVEDEKERKDLFDGFYRDLERKIRDMKEKMRGQWRERFLSLLEDSVKDGHDDLGLRGRRKLDGDVKKRIWQKLESSGEEMLKLKEQVEKYEVYDWTEDFLETLRAREAEDRKAERERQKEHEEHMVKTLRAGIQSLVDEGKLNARSTWQECVEHLRQATADELVSIVDASRSNGATKATLSDRRKVRIFKSVMKQLRARLHRKGDAIKAILQRLGGFEVSSTTTFESFKSVLAKSVVECLKDKEPEEGETVAMEEDSSSTNPAAENDQQQVKHELEGLVSEKLDNIAEVAFPDYVREVFELWLRASVEKSNGKPNVETKSSRKRRRDRAASMSDGKGSKGPPTATRSRSRSYSRSRSRSRSRSPSRSKSRSASRSRSVKRARSGRDFEQSSHQSRSRSRSSARVIVAPPTNVGPFEAEFVPTFTTRKPLSEEEEKARAEEIIRQARLKLMEKQKEKQTSSSTDPTKSGANSELEEGEEVEEGEITDDESAA